jgi:hypothetical protein
MDKKQINESTLVPPIFADEEEMVQRWAQRCWLDAVDAMLNVEFCSMGAQSKIICYTSFISLLEQKIAELTPPAPTVAQTANVCPACNCSPCVCALNTVKEPEITDVNYAADQSNMTVSFTAEEINRLQYVAGIRKE